jgi:hypothetical protein
MLGRRTGCTAALLILLAGRRPLQGQAAGRDAFAAMRSDSVAWQHILVYVIRALSPVLVRAAADTEAQPWDFRLPPAEPQRRLLEGQLRAVLRARAIMPTDSVTHRLEIGALRIVNDTAVVAVQMQETRRCPRTTRTTGFRWTDTVRVPRLPEQKFWGGAFSRVILVGDRVGC